MLEALKTTLSACLPDLVNLQIELDELTLVVKAENLLGLAKILRDEFEFDQLLDVAGVDYFSFGDVEWDTENGTSTGFSRGVNHSVHPAHSGSRFAVAYHLLSYSKNIRIRLKSFLDNDWPEVASVVSIWPSANWFEREAFDLFGIIFRKHPDLRRLLTDYGFIGHPFRKDFPLIGEVEVRYDAAAKRVIYEPVEIEPRILVPKVIRHDNRYLEG
ncbi:MAG: NADH-quinone oxidoreductase subunit C [Gammaproteobacteria bacterium]|jgi:NADH-quinone oxidoreductase subunit C|nr:NADH-quinone oxidoreductase subunit C [Gammaproteobacteria bacterium]